MDVKHILRALGGYTAVARHVGRPPNTIAWWRQRNSIPPAYWAPLAELARQRGATDITLEMLATQRSARARRAIPTPEMLNAAAAA